MPSFADNGGRLDLERSALQRRERNRLQGRDGDVLEHLDHLVERDPFGVGAEPVAVAGAAGGLDQARARVSPNKYFGTN